MPMSRAKQSCDVAVVGGGIVGAACAYELACLGADTLLIDRAEPGRATDAGAGILSPETSQEPDDRWFTFARAAADHYKTLVPRLASDGAPDAGYSQCGALSVQVRDDEAPWFESLAALAASRAPGAVQEITPREAAELYPPLGTVRRALYSPVGARLDGRQFLLALESAGRRRRLQRLEAAVQTLDHSGDRCTALLTSAGRVSCGAVVLASGAWSASLVDQLGPAAVVRPLKGQIVHLKMPERTDTTRWPILKPILSFGQVPWPDGRVACGGTLEPEAGFDVRPTAAGLHELLREALHVAPGLGPAQLVEIRVGLRPAPADGRPLLGSLPGWTNVLVATGHSTEGLLLGPYSARLVAQATLERTDPPELLPFSANRLQAEQQAPELSGE